MIQSGMSNDGYAAEQELQMLHDKFIGSLCPSTKDLLYQWVNELGLDLQSFLTQYHYSNPSGILEFDWNLLRSCLTLSMAFEKIKMLEDKIND